MIRIVIILFLTGISLSSLNAQISPVKPERKGAAEKMALRVNTRDRIMVCKGNSTQFRLQRRQNTAIKRTQRLQQRKVMMHQYRRNRQHQLRQQTPRRTMERQIMQQRQRGTRRR